MGRFVRVVEIVDGDAEELRRRAGSLPPSVAASIVATGAGVQVTLTKRYLPAPGSRGRSLRALRKLLSGMLRT